MSQPIDAPPDPTEPKGDAPANAASDARPSDAPVKDAAKAFDGQSTNRETPNARRTDPNARASASASAKANSTTPTTPSTAPSWLRSSFAALPERVREWATDPDFSIYFLAFMLVAVALFLRTPQGTGGGFVFDEQEAILANPYVRGKQPWLDAFKRDFWGLLPTASIGSYRPIPNFLWRALWKLQEWRTKGTQSSPINTPFVWFNLVFHATNGALLASIVRGTLKRVGVAWLAGLVFVSCAVLTEAVSGIVGIADVLGGLSLLLALAALRFRPIGLGFAVFGATLFGLLSKETAIVNVGLVPLAALMLAPAIDEAHPARWERAIGAFVGSVVACGVYLVIRHKYFFVELALDPNAHGLAKLVDKFKHYVGAPNLPVDPFNNPLAEPDATNAQRIGGALRVYARGVGQVVFPRRLSPDYSFPQEPLPDRAHPFGLTSWIGAALMIGPPIAGAWAWWQAQRRKPLCAELSLLGYALIAWPAAFFPLSNIVKTLPTVRAERFWYVSALATAVAIAIVLALLARRSPKWWYAVAGFTLAFLGFQGFKARAHANDFSNDLVFWKSAAEAVPNSAKAHLNYSVMLGARAPEIWGWTTTEAQEARLVENEWAAKLAPHWDMAFIYVGDTLCQLNRMDEAWEWYKKGFRIGPQNSGLIALALQCMSDHNALLAHGADAEALITEIEKTSQNSWYAYLARDTLERERKCRGVEEPQEPWTFGEDFPDASETEPSESTSASTSVSASTAASSNAKPIPKPAPSASSSVAASTSSSTSASPSTSGSEIVEVPPPKPAPLTTCGVDPKYRPRGLDGDPKGD